MSDASELQKHFPKVLALSNGGSDASSTYPMGLRGWEWELIRGKFLRAGINPETVTFRTPEDLPSLQESFNVTVAFGEEPLRFLTGQKSIDKWHLSPLDTLPQFRHISAKCIPTYDMRRLLPQPELGLYVDLAFRRAAEEMHTPTFTRLPERFQLNPNFEETLSRLDWIIETKPEVACDVETGNSQINTVGFAWSPSDAIAVNVLPDRLNEDNFWRLWSRIATILEDESIPKVFQNFIYDTMYFSSYGIRTRGPIFDTMWAQKFLWPELDMGLDNVGRIYTRRPYWKDDGKVAGQEGKKKDWGNVRDWPRHYLYNCRDTSGTLEASQAQRADLKARGMADVFEKFVCRFTGPIFEMCSNGVPFSPERRDRLRAEVVAKLDGLMADFRSEIAPAEFSPSSPKQVKAYLTSRGFKLPLKRDKKSKTSKETTDAKALGKLRLKYPQEKLFSTLIDLARTNKSLGSYVDFRSRPSEDRLRYSLCGVGTETGRWSGGLDPWGHGFNIQTIPRKGGFKGIFTAPEGWQFLEVDLKQAESRFVAYDSADPNYIRMLEDPTQDVHRFVAAEIFKCLESAVTSDRRQLGKKSGHAASYGVGINTLIESCLAEMGLVLTKKEAANVIESFHKLFPGIRKWHHEIRERVRIDRRLSTPLGRTRYFYGRVGDDMFREAYAYRPQSTIPDITNHLMLRLWDARRDWSRDAFRFLVQVHDSLIMLVRTDETENVTRVCKDLGQWHPHIELAGGKLLIPTEIKAGTYLGEMKEVA